MIRAATAFCVSVLLSACASAPAVNMKATRRVVGTESAVRIDAEIFEEMRAGAPITVTYVITNQRASAIAVADVAPAASFDSETRTLTLSVGAEVPGETSLPRLVRIGPGEKKSFTAAARPVRMSLPLSADPRATPRTLLRLKVNFLGDTAPFADLIDIAERTVADRQRADALFGAWLERNEVLYTNAIPVQVTTARSLSTADAADSDHGGVTTVRKRKP